MKLAARVVVCAIAVISAGSVSAATFEDLAAKATAAREADKIPEALELYQQALQLQPKWPEGWWFLGTLSYDSDRYEIGVRAFTEFVNLQGPDADKAAPAWSFLGLCEFETGAYAQSLEHIRKALEIHAGIEPSIEQVLRFHEALVLTKLGLFDQAMPRFMPFVKRGLHDPTLISGIGLAALRRPLLPQEVAGEDRDTIVAAGQTTYIWMAGDSTKMGPAFQALIDRYPKTPGVHYLYATYLLSFRPAEEAAEELKRELELNPRNPDALGMVALLMFRAGASSTALPLARRAAENGPMCPMAQYAYGLVLDNNGDLSQAIEHLESAERLDPANVEYHMALAGVYSKAGRHDDARRERKTSIAIARAS